MISRWLKRQPNTYSLKGKMFMTITVCFVFVVLFTVINNAVAVYIIRQKTNNFVAYNAEQTDRYLSFLFNKAKNVAHVFSVDGNVQKLSNFGEFHKNSYYDFYIAIRNLYRSSIYQIDLDGEIHSMYIYIDRVKYLINSQYGIYSYKNIKNSRWMEIASGVNESQKWITHYNDRDFSGDNLISFICRADLLSRNIPEPVYVSVNFLERDLIKILRGMKVTPQTMVYLIDQNDKIMSAEDESDLGEPLNDVADFDLNILKKKGTVRVKNNGGGYYQALYKKNDIIDGGIVVLIPESELLSEQRIVWVASIIVISLTAILFGAIGSKMIIQYIDKPISKLMSSMKKVEQGDFTKRIEEHRKDEFGYLYSSYNQMVEKIERLIQELYQEKLIKKDMEVKALQQQINPHFLYNTLDTINWIAKINKIDDISQIVISLSTMYRITFNKGKDFIRIGDMMEGLKCYLDIQKVRYDFSFDYVLKIDEHTKECWVLNLIVQTVVENAIVHGIDQCGHEGFVGISVFQNKDAIYFIVEDNGCGMSEEKRELITAIINADNISSESGLRNVQKRLKLKHGVEYGLNIETELGKGTKVTIKVPVIEEMDQEDIEYEGDNLYD